MITLSLSDFLSMERSSIDGLETTAATLTKATPMFRLMPNVNWDPPFHLDEGIFAIPSARVARFVVSSVGKTKT